MLKNPFAGFHIKINAYTYMHIVERETHYVSRKLRKKRSTKDI